MLHLAVSLVIIAIGGAVAPEGYDAVFVFWIFLGLLQWPYLYPAIRFSRSRGWPGVVLGMWIGGGMTLMLGLLQLGTMLVPVAIEKITGNSPPRTEISGNDSRVVSRDGNRFVIHEGLGPVERVDANSTETYVVGPETEIDFRGPAWRDQAGEADRSWLTPGRQVNVRYVFRNHERIALFVNIWVETRETPPESR
jgi:hypothetical protein